MNGSATTQRIAFFDAARAIGACLGVTLHTSAGFAKYPIPEWPRFGDQYHIAFDYLTGALHLFRVPVFFFLAGFFAYQLLRKRNYLGFIHNRIKRIAIPLIVFTILLHLPSLLTKIVTQDIHSLADALKIFENMSYLWFLEYLLIYYLLFLVIFFIATQLSKQEKLTPLFKLKLPKGKWLPIMLMFFFLYMGKVWFTPTILSVSPNIWLLGIYGIYFYLGTYIAHQNELNYAFPFRWQHCLIGLMFYCIYLYFLIYLPHTELMRVIAIVFYSISSYLFFLQFIAFCYLFFNKTNAVIEYISAAAYWIYLSHVFLIIILYHYVSKHFHSACTQFVMITFLTLFLSLFMYSLFNMIIKTMQAISATLSSLNSGKYRFLR